MLTAVLASVVAGCGSGGPSSVDLGTPDEYASGLVSATRDARTSSDVAGLGELARSTCATDAAADRVEALVGSGALVHAPLAPVIAGCTPMTVAAENLSRASVTPEDVVDAWMGSAGHRANILDPAFTEMGISCVEEAEAMLCSQVFLGP